MREYADKSCQFMGDTPINRRSTPAQEPESTGRRMNPFTLAQCKVAEEEKKALNTNPFINNPPLSSKITASVGRKGINHPKDVKTIQGLLVKAGYKIAVDGIAGSQTIGAIIHFQKATFQDWSDGLIAPGKMTLEKLKIHQKVIDSQNIISDTDILNPIWKDSLIKADNTSVSLPYRSSASPQISKPMEEGIIKKLIPKGPSTAHFSIEEFHCNDGTKVPKKYHANVKKLMQQLEVLRAALGNKRITINSGYRTPAYNEGKGVKNSQHLLAKAADIVVDGHTPKQVNAKILALIKEGKMTEGGVGLYNTFIHYDIRGSKARWEI